VKIAAARVIPVRLRFARPRLTARGEFVERASVLLELRDDDDVPGYGEAAPWPGFGMEDADDATRVLQRASPLLTGRDAEPGRHGPPLDDLLRAAPAARAAVAGALWDLAARRSGQPLADYLGARIGPTCGKPLRRVAVSALLDGRDPGTVREEASGAQAAGYRCAKLKLGRVPLLQDVARARAAREGLGTGARLRGDANGAWSREEASAALAALAEFDFEYIEQPLPASDVRGLGELRGRAPVRIAADESVAAGHGVERLLAARAVDVVVLKPATLGGPAAALKLAGEARRAGIEVVFTHTFESAIGAHHVLHCASAWGDSETAHGLVTARLFANDVAEPVQSAAGWAEVPATPGLGIAL